MIFMMIHTLQSSGCHASSFAMSDAQRQHEIVARRFNTGSAFPGVTSIISKGPCAFCDAIRCCVALPGPVARRQK